MNRERRIRILVILFLCALAALSVVLLRAGRAAGLLCFLRGTYLLPQEPLRAFGTFHLSALGICVLAAVLTGLLAWRSHSQDRTDRLVFAAGVVFFLLEWYKQLFHFYVLGNGTYDFAVFPFQFCSLPMYLCLLAPLFKGRIRHTLYCFLALFGTVGGYLVMAYPKLPETLTMCIYTMLWHSLMLALGVWLLITEDCGRSFRRDYLPAAGVFLAAFIVATGLNIVLHETATGQRSVLDLYYMSPYYQTGFFIVGDVQRLWGWGASMVTYALLFLAAGAFPIWLLGTIFCRVRKKGRKK